MIWTGGLVLCFLVLHFANFYFVKLGWVEGKYMIKTEELFSTVEDSEFMQFMIKKIQKDLS